MGITYAPDTFNDLSCPDLLHVYLKKLLDDATGQDEPVALQTVEGNLPARLGDVPWLAWYGCPVCGARFMGGQLAIRLDHPHPFKKKLLTQLFHQSCYLKLTSKAKGMASKQAVSDEQMLRLWQLFGRKYRGEPDTPPLKEGHAVRYIEGKDKKYWKNVEEYCILNEIEIKNAHEETGTGA